MKKKFKEKKVSIPPKKHGFRGINIKCSNCGAMFSEANGHTCGEKNYY